MILLLLQNYHNIITISAITFIHILLLNIITIITNLIITSSFRSFNISDNILRYLASQRKPQDFCFLYIVGLCIFVFVFLRRRARSLLVSCCSHCNLKSLDKTRFFRFYCYGFGLWYFLVLSLFILELLFSDYFPSSFLLFFLILFIIIL